jgi:hypothetical protein
MYVITSEQIALFVGFLGMVSGFGRNKKDFLLYYGVFLTTTALIYLYRN